MTDIPFEMLDSLPSDAKVFEPVFLGEGDQQIQIGKAVMLPWRQDGYVQVMIDIDVFVGERATLSRIAKWDDLVEYSKAHYPKKRKFKVDDQVGVSEPLSAWYGHEGKVVTVMPDHYRVMFLGIEGYSIFTDDELTKAT